MTEFVCPVCREKLVLSEKSLVCGRNHCFDVSKSGYVNLLISKNKSTVHGDNKLMVQARRNFLERGYYSKLRELLCSKAKEYFNGGTLLDAGCGEGYYTSGVRDTVEGEIYGIDISKTAVESASKRKKNISYATASVFDIPMQNRSCDMLLTVFSPYSGEEFKRVLKKDGIMLMAIPSEYHLWELKKAVYDVPYTNTVKPYQLDGFEFIEKSHLKYKILLDSQEDIQSLFSMTPYYYRTGKVQQERLAQLDSLETTADFELLVYKRIG